MLTSNPYNLPDKILKPNQMTKPITLQNKKSRDRSYDYSKQMSTKGIKIESQMKKSMNLQHITSSPNLHTPSTSSSTNRIIQPQSMHRPGEYHPTHIPPTSQTQNDRRIKFLFEKYYQMNEQITTHDSLLNKLMNEKEKSQRNSWDSPFQLNGMNQRESRDKEDLGRNQARSFHMNGPGGVSLPGNQANLALRQVQQLKKQLTNLKQQISNIKTSISRQKQQQSNPMNVSKSSKFNGNMDFQPLNFERKFTEDISRVYQTIEQFKLSNQDKFAKMQNTLQKIDGNSQLIGHKMTKSQQRIQNMESNIQNHMNLVNQQINNALTKIVASINEKISKALENNVVMVNEKLKKCVQTCKNVVQDKKSQTTLKPRNIEGRLIVNSGMILKLSGYRAEGKTIKIRMKSALTVIDQKGQQKNIFYQQKEDFSPKMGEYSPSKQSTSSQEIILNNNIYHIDADGYLMDENQVYLLDQNDNLLQLEADKLVKIKQGRLLI